MTAQFPWFLPGGNLGGAIYQGPDRVSPLPPASDRTVGMLERPIVCPGQSIGRADQSPGC